MDTFVSVIIPNFNGGHTLGKCLGAALTSHYDNFEVIVVDDASQDDSLAVIAQYPCRLVQLARHRGAAAARNQGVEHARGNAFFFTDADCLMRKDTLALAAGSLASAGAGAVVGGTYTVAPYDRRFCSRFQSVFIHYFETKQAPAADYLATHALAIYADTFRRYQGFAENLMPILEDVEFSHRVRRAGCRLVMNPAIQVQHIFEYSLLRSLHNAFVKSKYWTCYAIANRDLLADSGTASVELKVNVCGWLINGLLLAGYVVSGDGRLLVAISLILTFNLYLNRGLILAFQRAEGLGFAVVATLYYLLLYPLAVVAGALAGTVLYLRNLAQSGGKP